MGKSKTIKKIENVVIELVTMTGGESLKFIESEVNIYIAAIKRLPKGQYEIIGNNDNLEVFKRIKKCN